jgi:uncharacterized lipoprotein YbaY
MRLTVTITSSSGEPLPTGSRVTVQLLDTSYEDAPAVTLQQVSADVSSRGQTDRLPVSLELNAARAGLTLRVHVDVDRDGRVSVGDYVSTQSYPLPVPAPRTMDIKVSKVT